MPRQGFGKDRKKRKTGSRSRTGSAVKKRVKKSVIKKRRAY